MNMAAAAADGVKVRVVRCPKCNMLLPEPPNSPVYRCGGCNATLQAKKQLYAISDALSEKPDSDKVGMHKNSHKRGVVDSKEAWETDREQNELEFWRGESALPERMANSNGHSSSGNKELPNDPKDSQGFKSRPSGYDHGRYRRPSKAPVENWQIQSELGFTQDRLLEKYQEEIRLPEAQIETATGSQRPWHTPEAGISQRSRRAVAEGSAFSQYSDEGPSQYHVDSEHSYGELWKNQSRPDDSDEVRSLGQDRAEILRQLDELMERIRRSSKASGQSTEPFLPNGRRIAPSNPYYNSQYMWSAGSSSTANVGHRVQRSAYLDTDPVQWMNPPHDLDMHKFYLSMHARNEIPEYTEMLGPGMPNRDFRPAHYYPHRRLSDYHAGQDMGIDADPGIPFRQHAFYNQPRCSCAHCYKGQWSGAAPVPPILRNQRLRNPPNNGLFYQLDGHSPSVSGDYDLQTTNASAHPHESESHARVPSVVESEMGDFRRSPPPRTVLAREKPRDHVTDMGYFRKANSRKTVLSKEKVRSCQPLAGGAPFITCCHCLELLQLPKKLLVMDKNQHKLCCGACSKVVSYELKGRRLTFSMPSPPQTPTKEANKPLRTKNDEAEANNASINVMKEVLDSDGQNRRTNADCYSDDSSNSSCAIQSSGTKPVLSSHSSVGDGTTEMNLLNLKESEKPEELCSSSSSSDDEESLNRIPTLIDMPEAPDIPLKVEKASSVPGSPLHEHFELSPIVNKFEKGSRSQRSDAEKIFPLKGFPRQSIFTDQSAATETECSYNEYTNSGISQDSEEVSQEEVRPRLSKGGDPFLAGIIKKSFREFGSSNQSLEDGKCSVSVNGHPIPDHLVKKAERRAGPIRPGNYWYDYRAGFWGVMGFPCLGIIPPNIKEFDYSMPNNCAGGNTGVFVNGRELHQKDLDLLVGRGLSGSSNKSYVVEITGEVYDEATGQALESLGKLAPTVLRAKRGFGMKVPRSME